MTLASSAAMRAMLIDVAAHHWEHGWFPVPGALRKKPALAEWRAWARLARHGERPPWAEIERAFRDERVVGVGHLILAGLCVLDVDGQPGEAVLAEGSIPEAPEVRSRHGRHLYFREAKSLPSFRDLGPMIHLLGPGHYVELPPTNGKEWVRHMAGTPPKLPGHLRLLLQRSRLAKETTPSAADTPSELVAWRELLGEMTGSGPWRARCPLHSDQRASFSVFRGRDDGRLIGRCHAGCGTWTLRHMRHRLSDRRVMQYTQAHVAITALGDQTDTGMRDALRWVVRQAEQHGLDLSDPDGIGASYRQLAAATGLEQVDEEGCLSNRGRGVRRLLNSLRALGVSVFPGQAYTQDHRRGAPTRILLPAAWLTVPRA